MAKTQFVPGTVEGDIAVILMQDWDPIGIKDVPECGDEYDSYIPGLVSWMDAEEDAKEQCSCCGRTHILKPPSWLIAEQLAAIEAESMQTGHGTIDASLLGVASQIVNVLERYRV